MEMQPPFVAIASKAPGTYKGSWAPDPPRRPLLFVGTLDHDEAPTRTSPDKLSILSQSSTYHALCYVSIGRLSCQQ